MRRFRVQIPEAALGGENVSKLHEHVEVYLNLLLARSF